AWDLESGSLLLSEQLSASSVTSVGVEPTDLWIAASLADGSVLRLALQERAGERAWIPIERAKAALVTPDARFFVAHFGGADFRAMAIGNGSASGAVGKPNLASWYEGESIEHIRVDEGGRWCVVIGGDVGGRRRVWFAEVDRLDAARAVWLNGRAATIDAR